METLITLIARVSDEEQRKTLPAQKLRLEKYANEKGKEYEYHEFDESAHKEERQKFSALVKYIEQIKRPCWVVFDKIDRFTRDSTQDEVRAIQSLIKSGKIELHLPNENLVINQYSSATELFQLSIGMSLAKYYSDSISDNVKRRFQQMSNDGIWLHKAPIGYKNVRIDEKHTSVEIDHERARFVVRAFELRSTGMPYEVIAKKLADEGFRSKVSTGKAPGKAYLEIILKNPFYYGVMVHNGRQYPHKYEPLISRELFNACRDVQQKRKHDKTKYDSEWFTFKKIVKCAKCGRAVSSYYAKSQVYLRCSGSGLNSCGNPNTAQKLVITDVVDTVEKVKIPEVWIPKVIEELRSRHENQQLYYTQNIQQTRDEYDKLKGKMVKLYDDLLEGHITQDFHDGFATRLERQQQDLNDRMKKLTGDNKSFQITASYLLDLAQRSAELFQSSKPELQQKLLDYLLSNLLLDEKKLH
jgi:site-specific DNA recombinase